MFPYLESLVALSLVVFVCAHLKSNLSKLCNGASKHQSSESTPRTTPMVGVLAMYLGSTFALAIINLVHHANAGRFAKHCVANFGSKLDGRTGTLLGGAELFFVFAIISSEATFSTTRYLNLRHAKRHIRSQNCCEVSQLFLIISTAYFILTLGAIFLSSLVFGVLLMIAHLTCVFYTSAKFLACVKRTYTHSLLQTHFPQQYQLAQRELATIIANMLLTMFSSLFTVSVMGMRMYCPPNTIVTSLWLVSVSLCHVSCLSTNRQALRKAFCCSPSLGTGLQQWLMERLIECFVQPFNVQLKLVPDSSTATPRCPGPSDTPVIPPFPSVSEHASREETLCISIASVIEELPRASREIVSAPTTPNKFKKTPFRGNVSWNEYQNYLDEHASYNVSNDDVGPDLNLDFMERCQTERVLRSRSAQISMKSWSAGNTPRAAAFHDLDFDKLQVEKADDLNTPLVTPGRIEDREESKRSASHSSTSRYSIFPGFAENPRSEETSLATYLTELEEDHVLSRTTAEHGISRSMDEIESMRHLPVAPIIYQQRSLTSVELERTLTHQPSIFSTVSLSDFSNRLESHQRALRETVELSKSLNDCGLIEFSVFEDLRKAFDQMDQIDEKQVVEVVVS